MSGLYFFKIAFFAFGRNPAFGLCKAMWDEIEWCDPCLLQELLLIVLVSGWRKPHPSPEQSGKGRQALKPYSKTDIRNGGGCF